MNRIEEVLDCWFESGAMPYAQSHYPFENKERFENTYPADFIAEGLDQTRGWFYTLVVLGAALFNKNAFKNVVVNCYLKRFFILNNINNFIFLLIIFIEYTFYWFRIAAFIILFLLNIVI